MRRLIMKIVVWANYTVTLVAIVCGILSAVILLPNLFGIRTFVVISGSMEPVLPVGSVVFIDSREDAKEVEAGELIAFSRAGNYVVHRVIIKDDTYRNFTTKGDANFYEDPGLVRFDEMLGSYMFHLPYFGYLFRFVRTPWGIAVLSILLITIFTGRAGDFQRTRQSQIKKQK